MLKKLVCLPRILFLFFSILFGITTTSNAVTIHPDREAEGFSKVNEFALPDGIPIPLGDVVFSDDGNTLYILGGSETAESGVWSVPVTRDPVSGRVTGLETATLFFSFTPNPGSIDTSLEFHPSGNGTLFFRTNDVYEGFNPVGGGGDVGERTSDGTITLFQVDDGVKHFGGLAFMPSELRALNGIDLLVGAWLNGVTSSYSLTDNGDGTFTPVFIPEKSPYSNTVGVSFATGDQHFVPSGDFTNDLMFADNLNSTFTDSTIGIIDIGTDGFPTGADIIPFASGFRPGTWGLEFDPITNDLFVSLFNFDADPPNTIIHISGFTTPLSISVDIKPESCPNPLNVKSKGKLPVAILGTQDFEVSTIDPYTIRLNGVAPIKIRFEDLTCPTVLNPCDCEVLPPDTFEDLVLKFDRQDIIDTLVAVQDGDKIPLFLTAMLKDGITPIVGWDCVLIKDKGK